MLFRGVFAEGGSKTEEWIINEAEQTSETGIPRPSENIWSACDPTAGTHRERNAESKEG